MRVTENDTDLRGSYTLPGQLADLVLDLGGGGLEPGGHGAGVRDGRVGDTLAVGVKTTHLDGVVVRSLSAGKVGVVLELTSALGVGEVCCVLEKDYRGCGCLGDFF